MNNTNSMKAITSIPGWLKELEDDQDGKITASSAYRYVPLVFRLTKIRCDNLSSVPLSWETLSGDAAENPLPKVNMYNLIWRIEAALQIYGAALVLKRVTASRRTVDLQWINPSTVRIDYDKVSKRTTFTQLPNGPTWPEEEMIYIREFDPEDDIQPGTSASAVSLGAAKQLYYSERFTSLFFEGGAMPVTLLGLPNAVGTDERDRVERKLRGVIQGLRNAWKLIAVRAQIQPQTLTPPLRELVIPELDEKASKKLCVAFGVPYTMIDDAANFATAKEHRLSFWQDTIMPRGRLISGVLNEQLYQELGVEIQFDFYQLDIFQEDEADRSSSLKDLTESGVPLDLAMEILGYDLSDEQWDRLRGIELTREQLAQNLANNQDYNSEVVSGNGEEGDQPTDQAKRLSDWNNFRRKSIKRLKDGRSPSCNFTSDYIDPSEIEGVREMLLDSHTADDINKIFEIVMEE